MLFSVAAAVHCKWCLVRMLVDTVLRSNQIALKTDTASFCWLIINLRRIATQVSRENILNLFSCVVCDVR